MRHWLLKSEPGAWSWEDQVAAGPERHGMGWCPELSGTEHDARNAAGGPCLFLPFCGRKTHCRSCGSVCRVASRFH